MKDSKNISNFPTPAVGGLSIYLAQSKVSNVRCWRRIYASKKLEGNGNLQSAHKLVTSHLRLAAKIAKGYRGYGLPVNELISEVMKFMQAVKKFDPDKGFRLATYAMWWIVPLGVCIKIWSLANGTTTAQKIIF